MPGGSAQDRGAALPGTAGAGPAAGSFRGPARHCWKEIGTETPGPWAWAYYTYACIIKKLSSSARCINADDTWDWSGAHFSVLYGMHLPGSPRLC